MTGYACQLKCFMYGTSHFQHSVMYKFHRCTRTFGPLCITKATCFGVEKNAEFYSLVMYEGTHQLLIYIDDDNIWGGSLHSI